MFEKFPQLKRLERLLSKTQTFSPRKHRLSSSRRFLGSSSVNSAVVPQDTAQKPCCLDTFDSFAEACHPTTDKKQTAANAKNLYDSDDLLEFKNPEDVSNRQTKKKSPFERKKRTWTNSMCSPRDLMRSRNVSGPRTPKADAHEFQTKNTPRQSGVRRIGRHAMYQPMQEHPSSDALCVLSDEECEEQEISDYQKSVRYPLPTMPLAIMLPVGHLPEYVAPVDAETVLSKTSGYDDNIDTLMDARDRLEASYALFDDLCTSFRGPENLNRFLHSLVEPRSATASPETYSHDVTSPGLRSQSGARQIKGQQLASSLPPSEFGMSVGRNCTLSPLSSDSRLCRPTVSTRMKQVDPSSCRFKNVLLSPSSSTDSAMSSAPMRSTIGKRYHLVNVDRKINRKMNRSCTPAIMHASEEDAREDMMLRVRRGLLNLPWISEATRDPSCLSTPCPSDMYTCSSRSPFVRDI